ncbi:MAG: hypothetical protein IJS29_03360 [Selenomonadaceae bacterium]|nr:hypothetical protein [Selenomonadaceae bacterium]
MFDKQKIIRMTAELENYICTFPNIYILPEVFSSNVLSLLKRLNANVVAIILNSPNPQNVVQMPSGEYKTTNIQAALPNFQQKTGIVISAAKPAENPMASFKFNIGNIKIGLPAFALTDEEALAIYDRLTTIKVLQQYQSDGIITNAKDIPIRFARGMSTFIDSQFQDVKVQFWDRREFKIPSYDKVDDAAIVMQGPLEYKDKYTITTARLYRQWYPNAPIVISTWKNEATENFREECRKIGVVLLENDLPAESGYGHINYQLESSLKGVEYVKNNTSAKFALKCRNDQRINRTDFFMYFKNLLKLFPPNGNELAHRIILATKFDDAGTGQWMPFFNSDFISFSSVDEIIKLYKISRQGETTSHKFSHLVRRFSKIWWGILSQRRLFNHDDLYMEDRKIKNYNVMADKFYPSEIFILKNFYRDNIAPIEPSKLLQIYWQFLKNYLIIINEADVIISWPKYNDFRNYKINSYYDYSLDFARWLDIYLNYKDDDENF